MFKNKICIDYRMKCVEKVTCNSIYNLLFQTREVTLVFLLCCILIFVAYRFYFVPVKPMKTRKLNLKTRRQQPGLNLWVTCDVSLIGTAARYARALPASLLYGGQILIFKMYSFCRSKRKVIWIRILIVSNFIKARTKVALLFYCDKKRSKNEGFCKIKNVAAIRKSWN